MPDMNLGLGLGSAATLDDAGAPAEPNPNLLLWSQALDEAVWVPSGGLTVAANTALDPNEAMTAEQLESPALNAGLAQTSTVAAATGDTVFLDYTLTSSWSRQEISGVFDGVAYTFSVHLMGGDLTGMRIQLDRASGFLRCSIIDRTDAMVIKAWGAQLEQAASASTYVRRDGA